MSSEDTTPAQTPHAKAASIPPAHRGILRITGVIACALVAAAPWVAMATGADLDTTAASGVSVAALSGLLAILGKKIALSLIPLSGGVVGGSAAEILKALGVLAVAGVILGGCGGWDVAAIVAASDQVEERACLALEDPARQGACFECIRASTEALVCELDGEACAVFQEE